MNLLNDALGYAGKGWPVFPCVPNERRPACANGFHDATTDPDQIRAWWTKTPNANIGFCPGNVGMMVVDYDCNSDMAEQFAVDHGLPLTMTVNTPSGGYHEYYSGVAPSSAGKLADGVDIRSKGGYVILPPSIADGKPYESIHDDKIAKAPQAFIELCGQSKAKRERNENIDVEWNLTANLNAYIEWLKHKAKVPQEGQRNTVLASTAAMGRSYAIDPETTVNLIREHWNPRLDLPLEDWELDQSGLSGHRSATSPQGNMTQAYKLGGVFKPVSQGCENGCEFRIVDRAGVSLIKPPEWLIGDMIAQDSYTILFGAPGSYKTFLALDIALSIAAGHDEWLNGKAIMEQGPVMYVAGEGRSGIRQRIEAWEYECNDQQQVDNFYLVDPVPLVSRGYHSFIEAAKEVSEKYTLIILDTVSRTLAGQNENAQEAVSALTLQVDAIRRELGASVLCIHHTGHKQAGQDALRERGSSVFRADADTVLLMDEGQLSMIKQKEAEAWEKPLQLSPVKVKGSLVLDIPQPDTPLVKQVKQNKKAPANQVAAEKIKAQAFLKEELATRLLAKLPKGARFSTAKAAEFLAGAEPNGIAADTWRKYLGVLKAHDTTVREFYDVSTTQWVNR